MFDEMFVQASEEYVGGNLVGADENGELYKGVVSFTIVGLKENVPYVIKAVPERKIKGDWLKDEIKNCISILYNNVFNV